MFGHGQSCSDLDKMYGHVGLQGVHVSCDVRTWSTLKADVRVWIVMSGHEELHGFHVSWAV
jgi:hypothetical protein